MERKHLQINDILTLKHYESSKYIEREFKVEKVLGEGASCITYLVKYMENNQYMHSGVLKEFNPISEKITEEKFLKGYNLQSMFRSEIENAKNITSDTEGIYEDEHSKYILMSCDDGVSYDNIAEESLEDIIKTAIALTKAVKVYHDADYLHLDIKPDNIFILPQTREIIKLFDFDSVHKKEELSESILSCSKQWAAFELLYKEDNYKICESTDIYSIGAIVFNKIMGRMPEDKEKKRFSKYDFDKDSVIFENISPSVFKKLTVLFRKTLGENIDNRFESDAELYECLEEILKISDKRIPFLNNVRWSVTPNAVGREEEIEEIHNRLKKDNSVFIRAMGGVGKSELAKMYAEKYKSVYDTIQFVTFEESLKHTVCDNLMFTNFNEDYYMGKKDDIDEKAVFKEKLKLFESFDENTLIIIDNFNVSFDEDIDKIITNKPRGHKVIFTTRNFNEDYEDKYLELKNMSEETCLKLYFDFYGNMKKNREDSIDTIKDMLRVISYNTLLIKLIALNCRKQRIKPEIMLEKLKKCELSSIKGKINIDSENKACSGKDLLLYEHLCTVFDVSGLKKKEKYIMMNLSLAGRTKIDASKFAEWCGLDDFDDINSLVECGWAELDIENDMISLHHVISDVSYEELRPDGVKCSNFISSIIAILKLKKDISTHKKRQYINFSKGIAERLIPNGECAASFFAHIGKIISTMEDDKDECSKYLSYALDIYTDIYGEYSLECADIFYDLGVMYRTYASSFRIFEEDNDEDEEEIWEKLKGFYSRYLMICNKIYEYNKSSLAESYLRAGKAYSDMFCNILCLKDDKDEEICRIAEEYYIQFFNIMEQLYKEDIHTKEKLKKAAEIISDFYSDLINPHYSTEKSTYYRKKYIDNMDVHYDTESDECIHNIEYYMDMGESAEFDSNYDKALEYYKISLECACDEDNIFYSHYKAYTNICRIYKDKAEYDKALNCLNTMIKSCKMGIDEKAESFYLYGCIYKEIKRYDDAEKSFIESLRYWRETISCDENISEEYCLKEMACCKLMLSQIFVAGNDFINAEICLNESMSLCNKVKETDEYMVENISGLYKTFGDLLVYKKDFANAYDYYMKEVDILMDNYSKDDDEKTIEICINLLNILKEETNEFNREFQYSDRGGYNNKSKDISDMIIQLHLVIGNGYCNNELNIKEGLKYYNKGVALAEKKYSADNYMISKFYKIIGETYAYKMDNSYDLGMTYMRKCNLELLAESESLKCGRDNNKKFEIYKEAGECYERIEKYNEAIRCFKKSLIYLKDNISNTRENNTLYSKNTYYDYIGVNDSIVRNYTMIEKYDCAIEYEKDTLNIIKNYIGKNKYYNPSVYELAQKYVDIGSLYLKDKNYDKSEDHYINAMKCYEKNEEENIDKVIYMYNKLIDIYKLKNDIENRVFYESKLKNIANDELEL